MIREDREVLGRVSRANRALGSVAGELLDRWPDGIPAEAWREVALRLQDVVEIVEEHADHLDGLPRWPKRDGRVIL